MGAPPLAPSQEIETESVDGAMGAPPLAPSQEIETESVNGAMGAPPFLHCHKKK